MARDTGLRDRKKARTRELLADVAARLFAEHGYDAVSIVDVAREAEVSDQTVYNYFSAKQELVLDRADEFREAYDQAVRLRAPGSSPAAALRALVYEDIDRYRGSDPSIALGEFPAQCVISPTLRRYSLEYREQQVDTVAAAILATDPTMHPLVTRSHASALICVIQYVTDDIGARVRDGEVSDAAANSMRAAADVAFDQLDRFFFAQTQGAS